MKKEQNIKTVTQVIVNFIVIAFIALFMIPFHTSALTLQGFVTASEINPPNNVLYRSTVTGTYGDYPNVYACCATKGNLYYGVVFASTESMIGLRLKNINGEYIVSSSDQFIYNYNGTTIYLNSSYMNSTPRDSSYELGVFGTGPADDFSPQNQIAIDFYDYVISGGGGSESVSSTLNYNLPAGNVAFIEIGDGVPNISMMSTVMPVKSAAFSSKTGWNSTQRVGFAESLPSSGDNLASFGTQIEWIPDGNTNIFGQTQNAKFTAPSLSGHKYLVVVNPLYYAIQYTNGEGIASAEPGVNSTVNNNAVNIFMNYSKGITVYQLTQNVTINNNVPTYSNNVSSGPYDGDIDPSTGDVTWTDPEGGSSQPTTGGGNVPGTGENNFSSFLSGVANRIVNVFQPAHDAILTLSNSVKNIAGWMYALYVWLPAPVLSILTSAISLAIIIGLIKVFV